MAFARPGYDEMESLRPFITKANKAYFDCEPNGPLLELLPDAKSNEVAKAFNKEGEDMLLTKRYLKAIECFSKAIANAVAGSEEMAAAYLGRADALYFAGYFEECLGECTKAAENCCPKELTKKIERRMYKTEKLLSKQRRPEPVKMPEIPPENRNRVIKCASNAVEVRRDLAYGRQVVAARDIKMGEIISIEKPFIVLIMKKQEYFYCAECTKPCLTLIPCPDCTQIMYCGHNCRKAAFKKYHRYECKIMKTVKKHLMGHARIAIKIILRHKKILGDVNAYTTDSNVYCSDRFWEILSLDTHFERRPEQRVLGHAYEAAAAFDLFSRYSDLFEEFPSDQSKEIFRGLVMKLALIESTHFHSLYNVYATKEDEEIAVAIGGYSFLSLLNHSCAPNVFRVNIDNNMILMANSNIKRGEQIFDFYGYHYTKDPKEVRQTELKRKYCFDCNCVACANDWPLLQKLPHVDSEVCAKLTKLSDQIYKNRDDDVAIRSALDEATTYQSENLPEPSWEYFVLRDIIEQGHIRLMQKSIVIK